MALGWRQGQASRGTGRGTPQALRSQTGGQYEPVCHTAVGVRQSAGWDVRARVREWVGESAACAGAGARDGGEHSARRRNSGHPSSRCSSMLMGSRKISRPSKKSKPRSVAANREARPRRRPVARRLGHTCRGSRARAQRQDADAWRVGHPRCPGAWQRGEHAMQRSLAEAAGTFVLGCGGCGSAVLAGTRWGFSGCCSPADARCWPWPRPSAHLGRPEASMV